MAPQNLFYHQPEPISREEFGLRLASGSDLPDALVGLVLNAENTDGLEVLCRELVTTHPDVDLRGVAVTCLGHLARLDRRTQDETRNLLATLEDDPALGGRAGDALDDIAVCVDGETAPRLRMRPAPHSIEVVLYVADVVASRRFYTGALGTPPYFDALGYTQFCLTEGVDLVLRPAAKATPVASGPPRGELNLVVDDLHAAFDRAMAAGGVAVSEPPERDGSGVDFSGSVADPDGNVLVFSA